MNPSPKVAVVTSRRRRLILPDEAWILGLRAVCRELIRDGATLLIAPNTAGSELILRAAERTGVPCELLDTSFTEARDSVDQADVDRRLIFQADRVYVLGLRSDGNIHRLLSERLDQAGSEILLVDFDELQSVRARLELIAKGAVLWQPSTKDRLPFSASDDHSISIEVADQRVYPIVPIPSDKDWIYLTHTTRSCGGPWPDQSFSDYADDLLDSRTGADHSALGALRRIVQQRRLLASNRLIRGGYSIVSFTACPLGELPRLHRYRPHRTRWDFEPYGVCLSRRWLMKKGARPVTYGDDSCWESLSEVDRPFFQVAKGEAGIDWTVECEWRHLGNLDLSAVTSDEILLFVPNYDSAKALAEVTTWPITLWPDPTVL